MVTRNKKGQFVKGSKPISGFMKGHKSRLGMKHSEETKKKIGMSNKGNIPWCKGKKMSESFKKSISKALKGKPNLKKRGKNHHNWKGGITTIQSFIRTSLEYKNWRTKVFKRDDYTCQLCGAKKNNKNDKTVVLNIDHHPMPFFEILEKFEIKNKEEAINCNKLWDLNNGRTLCRKCHLKTFKFHSNQYVKH